jgi:hypothetical protein
VVDFRYHALSLVAVFLALGIGIVLGVTVGDSLVSDADRNLRESLRDDVTEAREQVRDEQSLGTRREEAIDAAVPEVAEGRLRGRRVALIAFGDLPADVQDSVDEAVELGGGRLVRKVELPPPDELAGGVRAVSRRGARTAARRLRAFNAVVVYRDPPDDDEADEDREAREALAEIVLRRLRDSTVGVETLGTDPSQVGWYEDELGVSVDNVDVGAGKLALVLLLQQAAVGRVTGERPEGSYGYKESSDRALPDLDLSD